MNISVSLQIYKLAGWLTKLNLPVNCDLIISGSGVFVGLLPDKKPHETRIVEMIPFAVFFLCGLIYDVDD